jgi:CHAT domain-containing protein
MFETAQWAQSSEAAQSLQQMAVRGAKGDPRLAALVREHQDLLTDWQQRDALRSAAVAQAPDKRNPRAETANVARLMAIDTRIAEIDERLKAEFPDYAALVSPAPLSVEGVQVLLASDEALILILDTPERKPTPEKTFLWVVTKTGAPKWVRSELGTKSLGEKVAALRRALDPASAGARAAESMANTNSGTGAGDFGLALAHELYRALFGEVEDMIAGKHLLIVPSGPLISLPFQVLVTTPLQQGEAGDAQTLRLAQWLIRRHALTVLPSVASLKAIRRHAGTSRAQKPYLAIANPLLVGPGGGDQRAFAVKTCSLRSPAESIRVAEAQPAEKVQGMSEFFRGNLANLAEVRRLSPLPETAGEVCEVGLVLGGTEDAILLGAAATETAIKRLSTEGRLAQYRVLHFATHGLVAREIKHLAEPALVLSPPETPTEEDDGLLTASEVAGLKLGADWVILSACNTAAGDQGNAQALSGLARAFFYAGARALLVSHWPVNSGAAVKLTTGAFEEMHKAEATDTPIGRAEALRRAMLALIDHGSAREGHPATWAPFVVVGEGGLSPR